MSSKEMMTYTYNGFVAPNSIRSEVVSIQDDNTIGVDEDGFLFEGMHIDILDRNLKMVQSNQIINIDKENKRLTLKESPNSIKVGDLIRLQRC